MRRILVVVILALLCSPSTLAAAESSRRTDRPQVLVVPTDFRTIQEAIDVADNDATIAIMPGIYETVLTVRGKRVHLVGRDNPEIRGPAPDRERVPDLTRAAGLINYVAGGGGSIRALMLTGGNNAIVGFSSEEPPGALEITDINIQGTGRAVLWCCAPLTVKSSNFSKLLWHAISIPCQGFALKALFVDGVAIVDSEKAGIYMSNCPGVPSCENDAAVNVVKNVSLAFNKGGGVLAVNSQLCVKDSNIDFATPAGMLFLGSAALTRGNNINFSKFLTDNILGDGILTFPWQGVPSQVTVENSTVYHPEGFGLRNIGSHMAAKSSFMVCAPDESAWVSEPGFGLTDSFDDQGGNKCGCPFANGTCGFPFAGPPSADIPPVGGLE